MRISMFMILIPILLVFTSSIFNKPISNEKIENPPELEEILKKCAEYCEKLESSVL